MKRKAGRIGTQTDKPDDKCSPSTPFLSFFWGGFECAAHRRRDGTRVDVATTTRHDQRCIEDYQLLCRAGIRTARDGLRWHLIEALPGVYDWSSLEASLKAANAAGTQVIWDLCHWGLPDGLDPFSTDFVPRFAAFTSAVATFFSEYGYAASPPFFCPINEVSFWAWVGGDMGHFFPYGIGRGPELKRQLIAATVAATNAVRSVLPAARFIQAEPIINITADPAKPNDEALARRHTESQFETWDMIAGRRDHDLGGFEQCLDAIGVNYYWNNQWVHEGEPTPPGHGLHRPLHKLLMDVWLRYQRPIVVTETGTEASSQIGWIGYVSSEVRHALRLGIPVQGICIYPVMDYPGWDDHRHCPCGLIEVDKEWVCRTTRDDFVAELRVQQALFALEHPKSEGSESGDRP